MTRLRKHWLSGAAGVALALAMAPVAAADEAEGPLIGTPDGAMTPHITVRDDLGADFVEALNNSVDADDTWNSVVQLFLLDNSTGSISFNCTGTLVNPRTVLTAAHCVNFFSSEDYGLPFNGQASSVLVGFGPDTEAGLNNFASTLALASQGGLAASTDVIIHPSSELSLGGLPFPWADVAMIALDEPITFVPSMGMLFSPLTELTHVIQLGYGSKGTGDFGVISPGALDFFGGPSRFQRLEGENMLGMIGSPGDLFDGIFPGVAPSVINLGVESQVMYWTDFDRPNREADEGLCAFTGFSINCPSVDAVQSIDYFDGDALPNEVGTAPGDSGSPLIADQIGDFPIILGVLSGGYDFFNVTASGYADISFYNPLFPFFEFISANTPYKYVSAVQGDGDWFDPTHWTQDLDPNFYVFDESGAIVNGLPEGSEDGVYATSPKIGSVLGSDISGNSNDTTPGLPPRSDAAPVGAPGSAEGEALFGAVAGPDARPGDALAAVVDLGAASDLGQGVAGKSAVATSQSSGGDMTQQDAPNFGDNLPQSSNLQGPGSTGFVPQNTDGAPGTAFENPALYFDVSLTQSGTTTLASDGTFLPVEIDQLTLMNTGATLSIENGAELNSLIGVNVLMGTLDVRADSAIITPLLINDLGIVTGSGVFATDLFLNRGGLVDPSSDPAAFGGANPIAPGGEIFIIGNYVQNSQGVTKLDVLAESGTPFAMDSLFVSGQALLDGTIWVTADPTVAVRGSTYTGITANGGVVGAFSNEMTQYSATLSFDVAYGANAVTFEAVAADFADVLPGNDPNALALAAALDGATSSTALPGGEFGQVIGSLDAIGTAASLEAALSSMTPRQTFVLDQLGLNASRSVTDTVLNRARLARNRGGAAPGGLAMRTDDAPILLASAGQSMSLPGGEDTLLPSNMNAWISGDVTFAGGADPAVSGDVRTALVSGGVEARLAPSLVGGLALTGGWFESDDAMHTFDGDTYGVTGYVGYAAKWFHLAANAGHFKHQYEIERPVFTGAGFGTASGETDGSQTFAGIEAGLEVPLGEAGAVGPIARARISDFSIEGYTETGAGGFGSVIGERDYEQTVTSIGLSGWFNFGEKLFMNAEILQNTLVDGDAAPAASAALVAQPGAGYTVTGVAPAEDWASVQIGVGYQLAPDLVLQGRYTVDGGRDDYDYEAANVSLSFRF
ncbi:MAG: autotransporter domain-containing protein [Oceanicaulis sp.]